MKKAIFFSIVMTLIVHAVQAQIKIGDNVESISPYALLELESVQKGLLIPRLTTQERNTYFGEDVPPGLLIYNTDTQKIQYVRSRISASTKNIETYWENISNEQVLSQSMGGTSTVENPVNGMIFYQENEHDLYVYNTALKEWVLIAGANFLLEANPVFNQFIRYRRLNGKEEVLDLSSFSNTDSQTIQVSALSGNNTLTIAISNGNTQTIDLSSLAAVNLFEVSGNVVRSSVGTSSHDFVFGSDTLDN